MSDPTPPKAKPTPAERLARRLRRLYPKSAVAAACNSPAATAPELHTYRTDPVGFIRDVLGVTLTPDQEAIARACVSKNRRVKVNSGHGTGKTFLAACLACWWFHTRDPAVVITTAPTERDVVDLLWVEIRLLHERAKIPLPAYFPGPRDPSMFHNNEHWAKGYTARRSESFQGRHRPCMMFVFDECHDDKTEVMTEDGWMAFRDVSEGTRLMTMDPVTRGVEFLRPVRLIRRAYRGEMFEYKCPGSDFCVTPGHRMLWQRRHVNGTGPVYGPWQLTRMDELAARKSVSYMTRSFRWDAPDVPEFLIPALRTERKSYPSRPVPMDDWLRFLGWYFSEGHLTKAKNKRVYGIGITQKDPAVLEEIRALCVRLGFSVGVAKSASTPQVVVFGAHVSRWCAQFGMTCLEKRLPAFIGKLSSRQIGVFLDTYLRGDGYTNTPDRDVFYTSSSLMAGDLQELILKTGVDSMVNVRRLAGVRSVICGHVAVSSVDGYSVSRSRRMKKIKFNPRHLKTVDYDGVVYCAELPRHHVLLTRRNGKVLWSGNCEGVEPAYWRTTDTMFQPDSDHCWIAIGNPTTTGSESYVQDLAKGPGGAKWNLFTLSCLNHPNVAAQLAGLPPPVPDAVTVGQIDQYVRDWTTRITRKEDVTPNDVEWPPASGNWFRPGPVFKARVLGVRPTEGVDTVWSGKAWELMTAGRWTWEHCWTHKCGVTIGVDASGYGDDDCCFHVRTGPKALWHESRNGWSPKQSAERVKELCAHWAAWYNSLATEDRPRLAPEDVDVVFEFDGGYGVGVHSHGGPAWPRWRGVTVGSASRMVTPDGRPMYLNYRAELWCETAARAAGGFIDVSALPAEVLDRLRVQLLTPMWWSLPSGARQVEPKADLKARLNRSPDDADALILSHAVAPARSPSVIYRE